MVLITTNIIYYSNAKMLVIQLRTNRTKRFFLVCQGYFVHIHSVEEVQQQVLKYINVIARPMILHEGEVPPPTWTHANIDPTVGESAFAS